MEVVEGNKLIAEFMGMKFIPHGKWYHLFKPNEDCWQPKGFSIWFANKHLKYSSSWDWLMPVVEKIERLGYKTKISFDDFGTWTQIHYGLSVADTSETKALNQHGTKIENTYKTVVEFIKWHNEYR